VELGQVLRAVFNERTRVCGEAKNAKRRGAAPKTKLSLFEVQRLADEWMDASKDIRLEKTMHRFPPPGERVVELRMKLATGDSRLILPTRDVLRETVLQHFKVRTPDPSLTPFCGFPFLTPDPSLYALFRSTTLSSAPLLHTGH